MSKRSRRREKQKRLQKKAHSRNTKRRQEYATLAGTTTHYEPAPVSLVDRQTKKKGMTGDAEEASGPRPTSPGSSRRCLLALRGAKSLLVVILHSPRYGVEFFILTFLKK